MLLTRKVSGYRVVVLACLLTTGAQTFALAQAGDPVESDDPGWEALFDGKSLKGWRANADPKSFRVVDGTIRAHAQGKKLSHLFYVGDKKKGFVAFKDFELELKARSEPNSNSGIFIHTDMSLRPPRRYLDRGYEIQLNSSTEEKKKTGSLYAIVNLSTSPVDETDWFKVNVRVQGKRITIAINDKVVVNYTEPENPIREVSRKGRVLKSKGGAIALQAHDPGSIFYFKDIRIRSFTEDDK
ncbi:MAG: DUF1080 domain-containing protein [Aureliella sp.]